MNVIMQEVGGEVFCLIWRQIRWFIVDGGIQVEFKCGIGGFIVEYIESVVVDKVYWRGGQVYLYGIEIIEQVVVFVVDIVVGFVGDDQVKIVDIQLCKVVYYVGIGGDVYLCGLVDFIGFIDNIVGFGRQILFEGFVGLYLQFFMIVQE